VYNINENLPCPHHHSIQVTHRFGSALFPRLQTEEHTELHDLAAVLGKELPAPSEHRLGEPKRWAVRFGEDKNLLPLPGVESRIFHAVTYSPSRFQIWNIHYLYFMYCKFFTC
jgi:hypothetical protein